MKTMEGVVQQGQFSSEWSRRDFNDSRARCRNSALTRREARKPLGGSRSREVLKRVGMAAERSDAVARRVGSGLLPDKAKNWQRVPR